MSEAYRFTPGTAPVLISVPHVGTDVPAAIAARFTAAAKALPDTDWHVDRLYDFAASLGIGMIAATQSRFVVDLNRDPSGQPLYPGADNTEVCPTSTFASEPIYADGQGPSGDEIADRVARYLRPYHERLAAELARLKERHGIAMLWDAHSIASEVPRFFAGRLPDLNLGTARGASADPALAEAVMTGFASSGFSSILNGRFTGGYITRHYGRPQEGVHAIQLEMAQIVYMEERPPYRYRPDLAARVKPVLEAALRVVRDWAVERARR